MQTKIAIPPFYKVQEPYILKAEKVKTKGEKGECNGWLLPRLNQSNPAVQPINLVYITHGNPNNIKGPHVHTGTKLDRFFCIGGDCKIVCRNEQTLIYYWCPLTAFDQKLLFIPPYNSHAIICGEQGVSILSMPNEGYFPGHYNQIDLHWEEFSFENPSQTVYRIKEET